jgi:hypothetical protein
MKTWCLFPPVEGAASHFLREMGGPVSALCGGRPFAGCTLCLLKMDATIRSSSPLRQWLHLCSLTMLRILAISCGSPALPVHPCKLSEGYLSEGGAWAVARAAGVVHGQLWPHRRDLELCLQSEHEVSFPGGHACSHDAVPAAFHRCITADGFVRDCAAGFAVA